MVRAAALLLLVCQATAARVPSVGTNSYQPEQVHLSYLSESGDSAMSDAECATFRPQRLCGIETIIDTALF